MPFRTDIFPTRHPKQRAIKHATDGESNEQNQRMESAVKKLEAPMRSWAGKLSITSRGAYHKVEESDLPQHEATPDSTESTQAKITRICVLFAKILFWVFYVYSTWWFFTHWGIDYTIFGNESEYCLTSKDKWLEIHVKGRYIPRPPSELGCHET